MQHYNEYDNEDKTEFSNQKKSFTLNNEIEIRIDKSMNKFVRKLFLIILNKGNEEG